jgi:hypothetical protein
MHRPAPSRRTDLVGWVLPVFGSEQLAKVIVGDVEEEIHYLSTAKLTLI